MVTTLVLMGRIYTSRNRSEPHTIYFRVRNNPPNVLVGDEINLKIFGNEGSPPCVCRRSWQGEDLDLICHDVSPFILQRLMKLGVRPMELRYDNGLELPLQSWQ